MSAENKFIFTMGARNIVLVTACGRTKENKALPAWKLYRSPRIRHLKRKANSLGIDLYILSAKYGLVYSEEVIYPYDVIMDEKKIYELIPIVQKQIEKINPNKVIYYKGGARREYLECIKEACLRANIKFVSFGYKNLGEVGRLEEFL